PFVILRQQDHVVVLLLARSRRNAFLSVISGQIDLATDYRLDPVGPHLVIKGNSAIHVSMVGDRAGWHLKLSDTLRKRLDLVRRVEQAIIRMQMQMYEWLIGHA